MHNDCPNKDENFSTPDFQTTQTHMCNDFQTTQTHSLHEEKYNRRSLTHLLTHSLTYSLTHSLTHEQTNRRMHVTKGCEPQRSKYANDPQNWSQICCDGTLPIQVEYKADALTLYPHCTSVHTAR